MKSKISSRQKLSLIMLLGAIFFLLFILNLISKSTSKSNLVAINVNTNAFYKKEKVDFALPVRFKIPRINIDAAIEYVGVTPTGEMDIPKGPDNVAWFNLGPRPGENGSAAIAGHYGWKNNIPAVFDNLYLLRKGDKIYIEDDMGSTTTFVVRELRTYGQNDDAPDVFSSSDDMAHLNLITCVGAWNETEKSYSKRLVVFTDKE